MPRSDDPRVVVRMTPEGFAAVEAAAVSCGVSTSGLVRECAERFAVEVAAEVAAGRVRIRRRQAVDEPKRPKPKVRPNVPGVVTARELLMRQRQERVNRGGS